MEKIKPIETVTELVNRIFSAYGVRGLDWEEKINEYADLINDFIEYDTDLTELYKKIRQEFAKLPQPSTLKKMLSKSKTRAEVKEQIEHPDNGKLIVIACYKNDAISEIREYIVHNTHETKSIKKVSDDLRETFDKIKVYEFCKGSNLMGNTVFIPNGYNEKGYVIEYKQMRIA